MNALKLGTRGSFLALAQTEWVARRLRAAGVAAQLVPVPSPGDGYSALRTALAAGEVDVAVHSYKDLPVESDPRLVIAAVPQRADPRDALVARDRMVLGELPAGAVLGTGSPRRGRQLLGLGLGLQVVPIRGNVDSRIGRVFAGEVDAVVIAAAGLARLDRLDEATELLDPLQMLPAPGQGALACECRVDDLDTEHLLNAVLDDAGARAAVTAERALLAAVVAGCGAAVGALADVVEDLDDDGRVVLRLFLRGVAATAEGDLFRASATAPYSDGPYSAGPYSDGPYSAVSYSAGPNSAGSNSAAPSSSSAEDSVAPHSDGELTDAENLGRQVAAELLDLVAGALDGRPSAARPSPTA